MHIVHTYVLIYLRSVIGATPKSVVIRRAIDGHKLAAKLIWKQGHYDVPKAN